jgi:hypothetical protein
MLTSLDEMGQEIRGWFLNGASVAVSAAEYLPGRGDANPQH